MSEPKLPSALLAYYDRIGAEVLNFRRAIIKEWKGRYYTEKVLIKVMSDGSIEVNDESFAPTKEEQRLICAAYSTGDYPTQEKAVEVNALDLKQRLEREIPGSQVFLFYDRQSSAAQKADMVRMVQHRYDDERGNRQFIPYTYWSDLEWRRMEPEDGLPMWKPKENKFLKKIMLHEGAKAAQAAQRIVDRKEEKHPWFHELKEYEHWGIIGGALAPQRTNYKELKSEGPDEVVYICDNDHPGKSAVRAISKHYRQHLKYVYFDERWTYAFDMADELSEKTCPKLFKHGNYIGPKLHELYRPGTWSTDVIETGNRGRPTIVVRDEFVKEWYHSIVPEIYVNKYLPQDQFDKDQFNNLIRPFSDAKDIADKLQQHSNSKSVYISYDPTAPTGIFHEDATGRNCLNTYVPSRIVAVPYEDKEVIRPWLTFLKHLVPNERDRHNLKKWISTLIARPDIKMLFGVLMISESQGVGKDTLGEKILTELVGPANCSFPSESTIVESGFNEWIGSKRLAVVHEIYAGHSSKAYDKIKSYITDRNIDVNKKYQSAYRVTNWTHMYVMSNSLNALKLSSGDRRWFVPKVTEDRYPREAARFQRPSDWWDDFYDWLYNRNGLGYIRHWCDLQLLPGGVGFFGRSDTAPGSEAKDMVIKEGFSPGMKFVFEAIRDLREDLEKESINGMNMVVVVDKQVQAILGDHFYNGEKVKFMEKSSTIRKVAKEAGALIHAENIINRSWNGVSIKDGRAILIGPDAEIYINRPFRVIQDKVKEPFDLMKYIKDREKVRSF